MDLKQEIIEELSKIKNVQLVEKIILEQKELNLNDLLSNPSIITKIYETDNYKLRKKLIEIKDYFIIIIANNYFLFSLFNDEEINIIVNKYFNDIANCSIEKKLKIINYIKDLSIKKNLLENMDIYFKINKEHSYSIFQILSSLKDYNYITNIITEYELYNKISIEYFCKLLKLIGYDNQKNILNNSKFKEYQNYLIKTTKYDFDILINCCDKRLINDYYQKIEELNLYNLYWICENNPTELNILKLKERFKTEHNEEILLKIIDVNSNLFSNLNDSDFKYFLGFYKPKTISLSLTNKANDKNGRIRLILNKEISDYIKKIELTKERNIKYLSKSYFELMSYKQKIIYLDHIEIKELLSNIMADDIIFQYIINLNDLSVFECIDSINCFCHLNDLERKKFIEFYSKLPLNLQIKLVNDEILNELDLRKKILSKITIDKFLKFLDKLTNEEFNLRKEEVELYIVNLKNKTDILLKIYKKFNDFNYILNLIDDDELIELYNANIYNGLIISDKLNWSIINYVNQNMEILFNKFDPDIRKILFNNINNESITNKINIIHSIKKIINDDLKIKTLENILINDYNALLDINFDLFDDEIFNACRKFIIYIYKYDDLQESLIEIIKLNNDKSNLFKKLLDYLSQTENNDEILKIKLTVFIDYFKYNEVENLTNLKELENTILINDSELALFGRYKPTRFNKENNGKLNEIDLLKQNVLANMFGLNIELAKELVNEFESSIDKIVVKDKKTMIIFYLLKFIVETTDKKLLKVLSSNFSNIYNITDILYMKLELEQVYNKLIKKEITGIKSGNKIDKKIKINGNDLTVEVIEVIDNFDIFIHSNMAYNFSLSDNVNYYKIWKEKAASKNDGICTTYNSELNLGMVPNHNGVLYGFFDLSNKYIKAMAPYDLVSYSHNILVTSNKKIKFMLPSKLKFNIRTVHSETIFKRINNGEIVYPDCIIILEQMTEKEKSNALKAHDDFEQSGIEIPIVYMDVNKIVRNQINIVNDMLTKFEKQYDFDPLKNIILNYESLRCGLKNNGLAFNFPYNRIYEDIIKYIDYLLKLQDKDLINQFVDFIAEESKKYIKDIDLRNNEFDLLDSKMEEKIQILKNKSSKTLIKKNK